MIVLDIETTGLTHDCAICEIGAINLKDPSQTFVQDCRIDGSDTIVQQALIVNGKSVEELLDNTKQSQKELIENYLSWIEKQQPERVFMGQNVAWDISMIQSRCLKYELQERFLDIHGQRGIDLHTIAQEKYSSLYGKYLLKPNGNSAMNLGQILEFCGLEDNRVNVRGNEIIREGKTHSALEDCKLEGEAFTRLKFGENLFPEYSKFPIPDYLKNDNL